MYSFAEAGTLILTKATISDARDGVSMEPSHIPWDNRDYYGGLVKSTESFFKNNHRGVAFMKYALIDKSFFHSTLFEGKYAATHWANNAVTYNGCTFNTENDAIYTYDAQIVVKNCTFNSEDYNVDPLAAGVNLSYFSPSFIEGSSIENNVFLGGYKSINKNGGYSPRIYTNISNNYIFANAKGVNLDGYGNCEVYNNNISGQEYANYNTRLGDQENIIHDNSIASYDDGLIAYYNCGGFNFINNCFDAPNYPSSRSLKLVGEGFGGTVHGMIEPIVATDVNTAAGNCINFTGVSSNFKFYNNCDTFIYTIKDTVGCRKNPNYFKTRSLFNQQDLDCGNFKNIPITSTWRCKLPPKNKDSIAIYIGKLTQLKSQIEGSLKATTKGTAPYYNLLLQLTQVKKCLRRLRAMQTKQLVTEKAFVELKTTIANEEFAIKAGAIGDMIYDGEYSQAVLYMSELGYTNQEEEDFINSQQELINRYNNPDYVLSATNKAKLVAAAKRPYPLNVYSKTVLHYLTGEWVEPDVPILDDGEDGGPRARKESKDLLISFKPNPANNMITIESNSADIQVSILNITGQKMFEKVMSYQATIDISSWQSGLYLVHYRDLEGHVIKVEKLIKQ